MARSSNCRWRDRGPHPHEGIVDQKTAKLVEAWVNENIDSFHTRRIEAIKELTLNSVLRNKNPYLFRAKDLNAAPDLVKALLDARLSSSEETAFGGFLEKLAKFVAENTGGASKSPAVGLDIDLIREDIRYLIAVKSGKNWGNSGQYSDLRANFKRAVRVIRQGDKTARLQPTLGICYGKFKTVDNGEFLKIGGQSFWHLISGDKRLYADLVEPLGYKAAEHNAAFEKGKGEVYGQLSKEFGERFCKRSGEIEWDRLVRFVSENMGMAEAPKKKK